MKIIRLISLQRNLVHAIANWILHQDKLVHQNNKLEHLGNGLWRFIDNTQEYYLFNSTEWSPSLKNQFRASIYKGRIGILSYENNKLRDFELTDYKGCINLDIESDKIVLSLRDFKNMSASWFYKHGHVPQHILNHWKDRALEVLGETNLLPSFQFINANEWFYRQEYRKEVCNKLDLDFTDLGIDIVPSFGGGSSFDGCQYDGKAHQMKVLSRWKHLNNNSLKFRDFLSTHQDLCRLSDRIFLDKEKT